MKKINGILGFTIAMIMPLASQANVIGTEYQNFAPTYSGLDFLTVESSETIKPCMCSLGLFFNYAKNTLTYSDSYYSASPTQDLTGKRANDYLVGADLLLGMGLTKDWDFGLILPFVVTAQNQDPYGVSYFDKFGLTEVRAMTKYRLLGDNNGGLALGLSANLNTIDNNPFSGSKPGPTINIQLMGDTTLRAGTKLGFNVGYRKRNPGEKLINPETGFTPPFVPFKDSVIFSVALNERFQSINSDLIAEFVGSSSGKLDESDSARKAQQAAELNLGLRHEFTKTTNVHGGLGTKFANAQASPDVRAYVGLYVQFGPICGEPSKAVAPPPPEAVPKLGPLPVAVIKGYPIGESDITELSIPVTAQNPNDYGAYRWKIGSTPTTSCYKADGYSEELPGAEPAIPTIKDIPDGGITMCAVAKNLSGRWQPFTQPTIVRWIKSTKLKIIKKDGYELFKLSAEVLFDFDKDNIRAGAQTEMHKIAKYLQLKPFKKVIIEGHTDSKGSDDYNLDLSQRRANQVKRWLIDNYEFEGGKFTPKGLGEKVPDATNNTDAGRQQNRRVEFKIYR
jgi:outer membrane protein OmpA-like peptidoglycan-associated protein